MRQPYRLTGHLGPDEQGLVLEAIDALRRADSMALHQLGPDLRRLALNLASRVSLADLGNSIKVSVLGMISLTLANQPDGLDHLRVNVYPGETADTEFHTHRTGVFSTVLDGELRNDAIAASALTWRVDGDHQLMQTVRTNGRCMGLESLQARYMLPTAVGVTYSQGESYTVPLGDYHLVRTPEVGAVTLCLFEDPMGDYPPSRVLQPVGTQAPPRRSVTAAAGHLQQLRAFLGRVKA